MVAIQGKVGTGKDVTGSPVLLGGIDSDGKVRTVLVDTDGTIQTSAASTPSLSAVLAIGNTADDKIEGLDPATAAGDAVAVDATALGVLADSANGGTKPNIDLTPTAQEIVDALVDLGLVTQS